MYLASTICSEAPNPRFSIWREEIQIRNRLLDFGGKKLNLHDLRSMLDAISAISAILIFVFIGECH